MSIGCSSSCRLRLLPFFFLWGRWFGPPGLPLPGFPVDGFPPCPGFGKKSATGPPAGLVPLGPPNDPLSFLEAPELACLRLCIFGPPRCASADGPLPPRPGGGGIGRPDFEIGPGGGGIGFPDAETGGSFGARCSGRGFVPVGFGLLAFTSFVEDLPVTGLDGSFLELTTLASSGFGVLCVFLVLLGGGFLELTALTAFSDLP